MKVKKTICPICGSKKIETSKHKKLTGPPKGVKINPFRKTTYGIIFFRHVCECGNTWEVETHL